LRLRLGFSRYKIILHLPRNLWVLGKRRKFRLYSTNFYFLQTIADFIHYLHNLIPYKFKGMVYEDISKLILKQGKKTKYR